MPERQRLCKRCGAPAEWIVEESDTWGYCDPCMNWVDSLADMPPDDDEEAEK